MSPAQKHHSITDALPKPSPSPNIAPISQSTYSPNNLLPPLGGVLIKPSPSNPSSPPTSTSSPPALTLLSSSPCRTLFSASISSPKFSCSPIESAPLTPLHPRVSPALDLPVGLCCPACSKPERRWARPPTGAVCAPPIEFMGGRPLRGRPTGVWGWEEAGRESL